MPLNLFNQRVSDRGEILGCHRCPLDHAPGIRKVKGLDRIKGRKAMLWAQCPDEQENKQGLELVGPAGDLLWRTLKTLGITRDYFDVQNVVRCRPTDADGKNRDPDKRELLCCSVYNDEAMQLNRGRAAVHVVLGDIAGNQLLGDAWQKERPVFWYEPWSAYVIATWHPSYILRSGGEKAGHDYTVWRDRFRAVRACAGHPGRFGFLKSRGYKAVRTLAEFDEMERVIRAEAAAGRRVANDIESGTVNGKRVMTISGWGVGRYKNPKDLDSWIGRCWSVVLDHPESGYSLGHAREMRERVKRLAEDASIKKTLANGSSDEAAYKNMLGATLRGYDYDTQYGTWLRFSFLRACGLEPLMYRFFPEFADYKEVVGEFVDGNFTKGTIDNLVLRNGGDCEVTQRLEQRFSPQVRPELVRVYIHAAKTLDRMESRGPLLDRENWQYAMEIVPQMIDKLDRQLQQISGDPNFNCGSDKQVAHLIYDVLGMEPPEGSRSTGRDILNKLAAETGDPTLQIVVKNRALRIIKNTFLKGYAKSADLHNGELRTIWWLTGAISGRLRSGRGDKSEVDGIINFQNIHGNKLLQNLLCSDLDWRKAL